MTDNVLYRNHGSEWSVSDLDFLEKNYRTLPLPELARTLGRTPAAIRLMAHKLACQAKKNTAMD